MDDLITMLANIMPRERLLEMLMEDLETYKENPSPENWDKFCSQCMMVLAKYKSEKEVKL